MYIVTFYSFKGGVGRSMAMMNVASELVAAGRRVLVVDFDLEAPGLETFNLPCPVKRSKGIVEFVTEYMETGSAPSVSEFVFKSSIDASAKGQLWFMPAGQQTEEYPLRLNSINWRELYEKHDGYLLFEDLKAQWEKHLAPDYVLIDSRTGHTDVGGICTRQLPDAVVCLFFPTEQNLAGLKPIVGRIREQNQQRNQEVSLHFVTSNVPDLDDEKNIRGGLLDRFQNELGYNELAATIHHYPSLALLEQDIFTRDRPNSRLAEEYRQLVRVIQQDNSEDREGALMSIKKAISSQNIRRLGQGRVLKKDREDQIFRILDIHGDDIDVLKALVTLREREGRLEDVDALLTRSIEVSPHDSQLLIRKAVIADRLSQKDEAVKYARRAALLPEVDVYELNRIVRVLVNNDASELIDIEEWPSVNDLDVSEFPILTQTLGFDRTLLEQAEKLTRLSIRRGGGKDRELELNLALILIARGKFVEASDICLALSKDEDLQQIALFNFAISRWGESGKPDSNMFGAVIEKDTNFDLRSTPNYLQCMSLACWAVGDEGHATELLQRSRQMITSNPNVSFSCWSYLYRSPAFFRSDLKMQESFISGEGEGPELFRAISDD